jgi:serine/threonine protein kinase
MDISNKQNIAPTEQAMFATGNVIDGKWVLIERIGKGGMGEVYRAHQLNLKRDVAIKVISAELLRYFEEAPDEISIAIGRFQREVQTMASVRHPNILQIYDYGSIPASGSGSRAPMEYIAMEYVPGNTFRFTMSDEGFGTETDLLADWLRRFYLPVLDGVEAIHSHGIVHRDIKPENILMDMEMPKITDFGLARSFQMRAVSNSWDVKGTMAYMAPEQFEDFRKAGPQADIYALGKILFEAVAGKMDSKTIPFKSAGLQKAETPLLQSIDAIIRKATHEDKNQRFHTVAELRIAVQAALEKSTHAQFPPEAELTTRSRWLWAGIITALMAVFGMTGYHLYGWLAAEKPSSAESTLTEPGANTEQPPQNGPPASEIMAADGRTMVLVPAANGHAAFYSDRTPVTFHHYVEFLNQVAKDLTVTEGVVKKGDDIWLYMGSGSEPYEQIIYENGHFFLRDAAWAGRPVVRVTWLGAQAYAQHFGKTVPTFTQWRAALSQPASEGITPSIIGEKPSPPLDYHMPMMGGGDGGFSSPTRDPLTGELLNPNKEWVGYIPSGAAAVGRSATAVVQSHVADPTETGMLSDQKAPELRYPWEGFAEVGFRTVITLAKPSTQP